MYFIRGIPVRVLNAMVNELRRNGLWAERHSYSIRIMYNGVFIASLHLYPGFNEAVLRLISGDPDAVSTARNTVVGVLKKYLPEYVVKEVELGRAGGTYNH
ncbi:hypothetical protein Desmu_0236 [Desulfurococcus mucosus DSM 2162]|uniref:Uncharacterized protein n=1 Tax=Desulfurococcus mucosus (strain ATCC 35584 / DSM 2162 / JCM 9187 / O7/1) TaxID=765177 RepID=E8R7S9_DESM0|nr:hypothetical protein Desmu_0236 [Desulfurococcus mucosus DSM 2162]